MFKKLQPLLVPCRTLPEILKQYINGKNHTRLDMKNGEDREAASIQFTNSNKCIQHNVLTCDDKILSSSHNYYGKAIPLQAWTAPKGSRRLRLPDFKTISTLK